MSDDPTPPHNSGSAASPGGVYMFVQRGQQAGENIRLHPGINLFGREEGILIKDLLVSRRHAQIVIAGDEYLLADLNSTNGTFVNAQRVEQIQELHSGDTIRMGETIFLFYITGEGKYDTDTLGARLPNSAAWPGDGSTLVIPRKKR